MAVELITGSEREHHDLDVVIMDNSPSYEWTILGTDNVTPGHYWADMDFDPKYLTQTAAIATFEVEGKAFAVETVHPQIIMAQKLSNAFGREPRAKDIDDATALLTYWRGQNGRTAGDIQIVNKAVDSLPLNQQEVTVSKIEVVAASLPN